MNRQDQSERTGVIVTNESDRPALIAHLAQRGIDNAKWFNLGDLDDLDSQLRHGQIDRVIAPRPSDVLVGVWERELGPDEWPAGIRVEYVEPVEEGELVRIASRSWREWKRLHGGRQIIAGTVLSVVVLAISFVLCVWLAR